MARDVFISYCADDQAAAEQIRHTLEVRGIQCWIAPRDIPGGQSWASAIIGGIEECTVLVVVISAAANQSRQLSREVELADSKRRRILAVRVGNVVPIKDLEYFLSNRQWFDFFPEPGHVYGDRLASTVMALKDLPASRIIGPSDMHPPLQVPRPVPPLLLAAPVILPRRLGTWWIWVGGLLLLGLGAWMANPGGYSGAQEEDQIFTEAGVSPQSLTVGQRQRFVYYMKNRCDCNCGHFNLLCLRTHRDCVRYGAIIQDGLRYAQGSP